MNHYLQIIRKLYNLSEDANQGYTEEVLAAMEERLQIQLPSSLRQYYLTLGNNKVVNDTFNRLLTPADTGFTEDDYLVFYEENQGVVLWGIKRTDLQQDNPPVYGTYNPAGQEWFLDAGTTENFLLSMAYWNGALGGLPHTAFTEEEADLTAENIRIITDNWQELSGISHQLLRFFTNREEEIIVCTTDEKRAINSIYVGTHDEAIFQAIMERLPLEWMYRSDWDE
ncbi:SMI1/KNR4 family protein [Chitinophaga nivalis]|uniref:SMI1/KNR4 family protein n=1 Tax=Chitinophaga nivalis TaxID=2991709 RepID=A0ABT3ITF3_9BACT|nr:SMI1/KNR4 family protein [Chitinophaga nivalis]MCW3463054.1 SMI1/KNR4 family protein [Chitinophaga nivalis]MCW3487256.1 SMI1/KNR4 family protein [Chitinophaga nivalis]